MLPARFAPLARVLGKHRLDAVALVPGANFRRLLARDFHQNERPLVVLVFGDGGVAAVVPNLELGSFALLDLDGDIFEWRDEEGYQKAFDAVVKRYPMRRLGVEGQRMRVFESLALAKASPGIEIIDVHRDIAAVRLHKTAREIEHLRRAIGISEEALEATLQRVRPGMSETEIEGMLVGELFAAGAEDLSFRPIVAAAENSARPHASARPDYRVKPGDVLLFDFGGRYGGMVADVTRTVFAGHCPDAARDIYATVLAANQAGRAATRAGVTAHAVDDAVQTVLEASPHARFRRHKTGHGLGLDVHEDPYIMRGNNEVLEPGMVFTIEPGLYDLSRFGVRIEDDVAVTVSGADCLTSFARDIRVVG